MVEVLTWVWNCYATLAGIFFIYLVGCVIKELYLDISCNPKFNTNPIPFHKKNTKQSSSKSPKAGG